MLCTTYFMKYESGQGKWTMRCLRSMPARMQRTPAAVSMRNGRPAHVGGKDGMVDVGAETASVHRIADARVEDGPVEPAPSLSDGGVVATHGVRLGDAPHERQALATGGLGLPRGFPELLLPASRGRAPPAPP